MEPHIFRRSRIRCWMFAGTTLTFLSAGSEAPSYPGEPRRRKPSAGDWKAGVIGNLKMRLMFAGIAGSDAGLPGTSPHRA